jgi:hypothetical protein
MPSDDFSPSHQVCAGQNNSRRRTSNSSPHHPAPNRRRRGAPKGGTRQKQPYPQEPRGKGSSRSRIAPPEMRKREAKAAIFRRHEAIPPAQMPHKLVRKANAHRNPSFPGPNQPRRDMEAAEFADPAVTASGAGDRYRAVR